MKGCSGLSAAGKEAVWLVAGRHSRGGVGRAGRACRAGILARLVCRTRSCKHLAGREAGAGHQVRVHRVRE